MIQLNIHEAKTHLSKYLQDLAEGESILLCKRNIPIAKIIGLKKKTVEKRVIGLSKGDFTVPESFFEPLPDDLLEAFEGH